MQFSLFRKSINPTKYIHVELLDIILSLLLKGNIHEPIGHVVLPKVQKSQCQIIARYFLRFRNHIEISKSVNIEFLLVVDSRTVV